MINTKMILNDNDNNGSKKLKNYNKLTRVFHALLWTAASSPQSNLKFLTFSNNQTSLFLDVFLWYEWSKVGKLRMFWNFQNLKNVKNRIHGKETDSEKKLQYHHKYPLAQSYILFTPATWGDYCRVPTVVCPLCVQVAEVLVTFLMRLKLAVTKENFLR